MTLGTVIIRIGEIRGHGANSFAAGIVTAQAGRIADIITAIPVDAVFGLAFSIVFTYCAVGVIRWAIPLKTGLTVDALFGSCAGFKAGRRIRALQRPTGGFLNVTIAVPVAVSMGE